MVSLDVLTMGRISVDVYPLQTGVSLREVESFGKYLGGSPTNVAVAAARHGRASAVITRTGQDPFGEFLHDALRGFGVDDRYVTAVPGLPTPVAFCEIFPPDDFPLYFYREPKAPDMEIRADELDYDAIRAARVFWVTVTGLSDEPSRSATLAALEARAKSGITVLDLDYRPMFWPSREAAREWVGRALDHVTVAVGNLDETDTAVGEREPRAAARALRDRGVELAVVKQGPRGVLADDGQTAVEVPPVPVEVVNGLGPATRSAARSATGCCRTGTSSAGCASATPPGRSSPRGSRARMPCRPPTKWRSSLSTLEITPEDAGWGFCGLRIIEPGEHALDTGEDELIVLPLEGGAEVTVDGDRFTLEGREGVWDGPTDFVYVPRDARVEISGTGRVALPSSRAWNRREPRHVRDVAVELRGAGRMSRQIHSFCGPDTDFADRLIAVEVITPGGNWSSYPPHKHDEDIPGVETALEEIYYFEVADGGFAYQRAYGPEVDILEEVRSGDTVLLPSGYHGPSMAAPGYDLYYLNVMAGPGERAWRFTDDPAHAWIRGTWADQEIDPRLPMRTPRRHA